MRARHLRALAVLIIVLCGGIAFVGWHLFRQQTYDNPALGLLTIHYRWGRSAWMTLDSNRDGRINARARIDKHGLPQEYWEDSNFDGKFDRHAVMDGDTILYIELDQDGNGEYETRLEGQNARRFYEKYPFDMSQDWYRSDN